MDDTMDTPFDLLDIQKSFANIPFDDNLRLCLWNNPVHKDLSIADKYSNFKVIYQTREYNFIKSIVCQLCKEFDHALTEQPELSVLNITQNYDPELFHKCMCLLGGSPLVEIKKEDKLRFAELVLTLGIDTENFQKKLFENLRNSITSQNVLQTIDFAFRHSRQDLLESALEALKVKYSFEPMKDFSVIHKISTPVFQMAMISHNKARAAAKQAGESVAEHFLNPYQSTNLINTYIKTNTHLFNSEEEREQYRDSLLSQIDFEEPVKANPSQDDKQNSQSNTELQMMIGMLNVKFDRTMRRLEALEDNDRRKDAQVHELAQKVNYLEGILEKKEIAEVTTYVERFKSVTKGPNNHGWLHTNKLDAVSFSINQDTRIAGLSIYLPHTAPKPLGQPMQTSQPGTPVNPSLQQKNLTSPISPHGSLYPQTSVFGNTPLGKSTNPGMSQANTSFVNMGPSQMLSQPLLVPQQQSMMQQQQQPMMQQSIMQQPMMQQPMMQQNMQYSTWQPSTPPPEPIILKGFVKIIEGLGVDGPVLVEKEFEVKYSHVAGKGDQTMEKLLFDRFVRAKANQWYTIVQTGWGPQTFFGENGYDVITKGERCFMFKSLNDFPNNNGSDMSKGQVPRIFYTA